MYMNSCNVMPCTQYLHAHAHVPSTVDGALYWLGHASNRSVVARWRTFIIDTPITY